MRPLPDGAPATLQDAFAYVGTVTAPTLDDLKVMVLVEAASKELYHRSAEPAEDERIRALLIANGHEEMVHAGRVSEAIKLLSGEDYPPPSAAENPYLTGEVPLVPMDPAAMKKLAEGEFGGEGLYEGWAAHVADEQAAALLRQNGREETDHGNRLLEAAALLAG